MEEYIEFLRLISLYNEIIRLDENINSYIKRCENNKHDSQVLPNLTRRLEEYICRKRNLLRLNELDSYIPLLFNIITKWENIIKKEILFNIDININLEKYQQPLYSLIQSIINKTGEFKHIYKYIIENGLYDPNHACGTSFEPFFSLLPDHSIPDLKKYNAMVILNPKTDFHILRNGMDIIEYALIGIKYAKNIEERDYWEKYILWSLQGTCSILDSKRFHGYSREFSCDYQPSIMNIFSDKFENTEKIKEYLLTVEGAIKQCQNALYPSIDRNEAIDFYLSKLELNDLIKKRLLDLKI